MTQGRGLGGAAVTVSLLIAVVVVAGCTAGVGEGTSEPTRPTGAPIATDAPTASVATAGPPGSTASSATATAGPESVGTPVEINGQLRVCGTQLCNQFDQPIQLRGMSTHGLQWYGWGACIGDSSLDALALDWGADIVRVSMYVQEGGYETDPDGFTAQAETIVDALIARGLYVLLDWHMLDPGDPTLNAARAKAYFGHMAARYGQLPNMLYEIANEPSGVSWATIKAYADDMLPVLRRDAPDGIVIIGTPAWSSFGVSEGGGPAEVAAAPVVGENVVYTFHFYAATHGQEYRDALTAASDALPVFVTEWGAQEYTGDGANDFDSAQAYLDLLAARKISWTSWNYSDDERSGAAFQPGTCPDGPWSGDSLKLSGAWVRDRIRNPADDFPTN